MAPSGMRVFVANHILIPLSSPPSLPCQLCPPTYRLISTPASARSFRSYGAQFPSYAGLDTPPGTLAEVFAWTRLADDLEGSYITTLRTLAVRYGIAIAAGMMRRDSSLCGQPCASAAGGFAPPRNSVILIDRHGRIVYTWVMCIPPLLPDGT